MSATIGLAVGLLMGVGALVSVEIVTPGRNSLPWLFVGLLVGSLGGAIVGLLYPRVGFDFGSEGESEEGGESAYVVTAHVPRGVRARRSVALERVLSDLGGRDVTIAEGSA